MPLLTLVFPLRLPLSILLRGPCGPKSPVSWGQGDGRTGKTWECLVLTVHISLLGQRAGRGEGRVAFWDGHTEVPAVRFHFKSILWETVLAARHSSASSFVPWSPELPLSSG